MKRELPFSLEELRARVERVESTLSQQGLDGAILTGPENIYYLTGNPVSGPMALIVRRGEAPHLVADEYDEHNIRTQSWIESATYYRVGGSWREPVARIWEQTSARRIGIDAKSAALSLASYERLRAALPNRLDLLSTTAVEDQRLVKSPAEQAYIRTAAAIAVDAMRAGVATVRPGRTENDVAAEIYRIAILRGSEHLASQPYVKAGPRASVTHGRWDGRRIEPRDLVFIELAGCVRRYHAALMRSVICGEPEPRAREIGDAVLASLQETLAVLRPGVPAGTVDHAYRQTIAKAGLDAYNRHALGYSIGIAFAPGWGEPELFMLSPEERRPVREGMTFHLVLSVTLPGEIGHVACSATVLVRADGPEVLTDFPREVVVVPA
jgi:Xaa-Pro dipeptidase